MKKNKLRKGHWAVGLLWTNQSKAFRIAKIGKGKIWFYIDGQRDKNKPSSFVPYDLSDGFKRIYRKDGHYLFG